MEKNKPNTDKELILQIVGYNAEAFQQLFNRYSPSILGLIKEIISNPKLSEKVLLNVFSVFLKRIDYLNTTSSNVYTYLTLLARNIAIDIYKRMKFIEDIPIYSDEYEIEFILPHLSEVISPIDLNERFLHGENIKTYRAQLTEVQNLLLSLIYFEGLNEEEIAKRLNVPMVTIRQKVLVIMETLQKQYAVQTSTSQANNGILELIKLEALGFLTSEERMLLVNLKETDPNFLWKELGEYQNLTALISTTIQEQVLPRNLDEEVLNIFTRILLQDGDVEYPIVSSEIPVLEPEPLKSIDPIIPVKVEQPVKTEPKDNEFHLKFREPDPTELNILRKLDRTESKQNTIPVLNKVEKENLLKEVKTVINKPDVVISRIVNSPTPKEVVKTILKENIQIQNKLAAPQSPSHNIVNDDPLIVIEGLNPVIAKTEDKPVSRLTPTSSIKIEDIIKKENNPPIKRNTLVENSKLINPLQAKQVLPETPVQAERPKAITSVKESLQADTVSKQKADINLKSNPAYKETRPETSTIENEAKPVESANTKPASEKFEIKIKTNEAPNEIKPSSINQAKNADVVQNKEIKPAPKQQPEIKFRTNEPPTELRRTTFPPDYPKKPVEIKSASPVAERPVTQMKQVEQPKEKANQSVTQIADVKPIENKKVVQSAETEKTNHKSEDAQKLNSLFRTKDKKIVESLNEKNSAVNKPSLKIRETKFVEDEVKQNQALKVNPKVEDIKSVVENLLKDKHLTGTLTVDEVLSKLNQENLKPQPEPIDNELAFEQEIQNINKKRKIGILVSTVLFVAVAVTAIFVYLKLQPDTLQAASEIKLNKQQVVTNPQVDNVTSNESNLAVNETIPTTEPAQIEDKQDELTKTEEEKPTTENQIKITPINNNLGKQDESYTQLNENNSSNTQLNNQTAAAKTETTTPPKENKPKEEEPSVFVAVEEMPQLVGGLKQLQTKIKYPEIAKRTGIEGKVYVTAIVDENGNVISASTTKGIGAGCDEAAIDAVRNSKFTPGKQRGKNVKVQVTIPIMFKKY